MWFDGENGPWEFLPPNFFFYSKVLIHYYLFIINFKVEFIDTFL